MAAANNDRPFKIEALNELFSPSRWSRRCPAKEAVALHVRIVTQASERVKQSIPNRLDVQYGSSPHQRMDIFGEEILPSSAPLIIYIHGGFWQELSRHISSYCVEPMIQAGCVVGIVGYDLAPKVSLDEIVQQMADACSFCVQLAKSRGSSGIVFCGHSAGAHLVAMLAQSVFLRNTSNDIHLIKGFVLISGIYDLTQLYLSYVNDALHLTLQDAERLSPLLCQPILPPAANHLHILIFVGDYESPEFKEQSQRLEKALHEHGGNVSMTTVADVDHFQIVERLQEDDFAVTKSVLQWMRAEGILNTRN